MTGAEIIRAAAARLVHKVGAGERVQARDMAAAAIVRSAMLTEHAGVGGLYGATCFSPPEHLRAEFIGLRDEEQRLRSLVLEELRHGRMVFAPVWADLDAVRRDLGNMPVVEAWSDVFHNTVVTEGKNAILTHFLKGSSYTASQVLGLIESTGYSAISATNTAANITAAGGGSPTNGWNEATSSMCAARQTPSFGTASAGSLAASATSHSILATLTSKGAFLMCRSTAGTAPSTTVGNTNGALYSAGLYSGGDRSGVNGDTLQVTYTASA